MNKLNRSPIFSSLAAYPALLIGLALAVTARPSTEISWVKYSTVWNNLSSLTPVGSDKGRDQYLARLTYENNVYAAKYIPAHNKHRLYWNMNGGQETLATPSQFERYNVEFLKYPSGVLHWVYVTGSRVPKNNMLGIGKVNGEIAYPCRTYRNFGEYNVISGYYLDSKGECSYPTIVDGKEKYDRDHEVLVLSPYGRAIGATLPPVP